MPHAVLLGLAFAAVVSVLAVRAGALTPTGALASTALGTLVFDAGGFNWAAVLVSFFLTSSALSRGTRAGEPIERVAAGGSRRTARQVLANGSVAGAWSLLELAHHSALWPALFAAALAAATADTWSTEIGRRSASPPRDILTGRVVTPGTSGGVTPLGLAGGLAGSGLIACVSALAGLDAAVLPVTVAGFAGALLDSLLGASAQERRWCSVCLSETEQRVHRPCGTPTEHLRGRRGLDNDWVNLLSTFAGSAVAAVLILAGGLP